MEEKKLIILFVSITLLLILLVGILCSMKAIVETNAKTNFNQFCLENGMDYFVEVRGENFCVDRTNKTLWEFEVICPTLEDTWDYINCDKWFT